MNQNQVAITNNSPDTLVPQQGWQPQQQSALTTAVASSTKAEIEAQLMMADARPRNEINSIQKIMISCDRPRLAESAVYEYSKGGTAIMGPSIRLLETIAQKWGNIKWGFHELSRQKGSSVCMCYAIDLESNARVERMVVVEHEIQTKRGVKQLTDEREIYEWIANKCQRRVRTCLENIIPRDVVEDALDACQQTAKANVTINADVIKKTITAFQALGVTKDHIEKLLQRNFDVETVTPGNILRLRRIHKSITDGMSEAKDHFDMEAPVIESKSSEMKDEAPKPKKKKAPAKKKTATPPEEPENPMDKPSNGEPPTTVYNTMSDEPPSGKTKKAPWNSIEFTNLLDQCDTESQVNELVASYDMDGLDEDAANWAMSEINDRKNTIFEQNNNG